MATPKNIDLFNRFCLAVFEKLYLSFPVPIEINTNDLMMSVVPADIEIKDAFLNMTAGGHAIDFLKQEGFLTHEGALLDGTNFLQVQLTMKGLAVLGAVPSSLEKRESLIGKILALTGKGIREAATEQVSELAGQAFTFALASAPAVASAILRP